MQSVFFTPKVLKELRRLHQTIPPGNRLLFIGLPRIIVVPMLLLCLLYAADTSTSKKKSNPETKPAASDKNNSSKKMDEKIANSSPEAKASEKRPTEEGLILTVMGVTCFTPVAIAAVVVLFVVRHILNAQFIKAHTIHLTYPMERAVEWQYRELTRWLSNLRKTGTFQIVPEGRKYVDVGEKAILRSLPRYLDCDLDVYCLAIGTARYYLLPESRLRSRRVLSRNWHGEVLPVARLCSPCRWEARWCGALRQCPARRQ